MQQDDVVGRDCRGSQENTERSIFICLVASGALRFGYGCADHVGVDIGAGD